MNFEVKVTEILPDNERTADIMKKRAEEEEFRRQKLEELKAMEEKKDKQRKLKEKNEQADRQRKEKMAKDQEAQKLQEDALAKKLDGRMALMLESLQQQASSFEYTVSGLDLGTIRCNFLAKNIAYNHTLLSIHMSRK